MKRKENRKMQNTKKKKPTEVFKLEKQHLRPVIKEISITNIDSSITRTVRKDNTIMYESNRYSVPLGTYEKNKEVLIEVKDENSLVIRKETDGDIIDNNLIYTYREKH